MPTYTNEKRVAKNTLVLYLRLLLTMAISLYTSRVVLNTLGVEDFGIYSVVAGFISMFSVLSDSLSVSVSRFITIALGNEDLAQQKRVFATSVNIQVILTAVIILLSELAGLWFISEKINVPAERTSILNTVFQLAVANFSVSIVKVAFTALIFAHEKAAAFAWLTISESVLKLTAIIMLSHSSADRLVLYVALLLGINVLMTFVTVVYCATHFNECRYRFTFDVVLIKQMFGFSAWNLIGRSSSVMSGQGVNMLLNVFFGVAVNAARGIAVQVDGATQQFVNNLMIAINPQILKSYAKGDFPYMRRLICKGGKFAGYIVLLYTIPIIFETPQILHLWLGQVPNYAVVFTRLTLISTLFFVMTHTLSTAVQATGRIRNYQILTSVLVASTFPLAYTAFKFGAFPVFAYVFNIAANAALIIVGVCVLKRQLSFSARYYVKEVTFRVLTVGTLASLLPAAIVCVCQPTVARLILVAVTGVVLVALSAYSVGMTQSERMFILDGVRSKLRKGFLKNRKLDV